MTNPDNNAVVRIDPKALSEKLRERVRAQMGDLIPDETWDALLKKEINDFFEVPAEKWVADEIYKGNSTYGNRTERLATNITPFRYIVWKEVAKVVGEKLSEIAEEGWGAKVTQTWDGMSHTVTEVALGDKLKELFEEMIPKIMVQQKQVEMASFAASIFENVKNEFRNQGYNI